MCEPRDLGSSDNFDVIFQELTTKVYQNITKSLQEKGAAFEEPRKTCVMLGIDIDPILIERASEMNKSTNEVVFKCIDFMNDKRDEAFQDFVSISDGLFDVIFCFSITILLLKYLNV